MHQGLFLLGERHGPGRTTCCGRHDIDSISLPKQHLLDEASNLITPARRTNGRFPMTKLAIILGSTGPGRNGEQVPKWVYAVASKRTDAGFELVELLDYKWRHLDEVLPPAAGQYSQEHTFAWA